MKTEEIARIENLACEIKNFKDCYRDTGFLWGTQSGEVNSDELLSFLMRNPHLQEIASNIDKLK